MGWAVRRSSRPAKVICPDFPTVRRGCAPFGSRSWVTLRVTRLSLGRIVSCGHYWGECLLSSSTPWFWCPQGHRPRHGFAIGGLALCVGAPAMADAIGAWRFSIVALGRGGLAAPFWCWPTCTCWANLDRTHRWSAGACTSSSRNCAGPRDPCNHRPCPCFGRHRNEMFTECLSVIAWSMVVRVHKLMHSSVVGWSMHFFKPSLCGSTNSCTHWPCPCSGRH